MVRGSVFAAGCLLALLTIASCVRSQDYSLSAISDADNEATVFMDGFSVSLNESAVLKVGDFLTASGPLKQNPDGSFNFMLEGQLVESEVVPIGTVDIPSVKVIPSIPEDIHNNSHIILHAFEAAMTIENTAPFDVTLRATAVARRKDCADVSFPIVCTGKANSTTRNILSPDIAPGITEAVNLGPEEIEIKDIKVSALAENPTGGGKVKLSYSFNAPLSLDRGSWLSFSKAISNKITIPGIRKSLIKIDASLKNSLQLSAEFYISLYVNGVLVTIPEPVMVEPCLGGESQYSDFTITLPDYKMGGDLIIGPILVDATYYADSDGVSVDSSQEIGIILKNISFPEGITTGGTK